MPTPQPYVPPISSGTGDIVLAPSGKKSKKGLLVGLLFSFLVLVAGVCVFLYFFLFGDKTGTVISLLQEKAGSVQIMEQLYIDSYFGDLTVAQVFTEKKHEEINNAMGGFSDLQKELSEINAEQIDEGKREDFRTIQERLNARAEYFQKAVDFYNKLYDAYLANNPDGLLELVSSEDYYMALVAGQFYDYITEHEEWQKVINDNNCSLVAGDELSEVCAETVSAYAENINSFLNSTTTVSAIFNITEIPEVEELLNADDINGIDDILIIPYINKMIGGGQ
ncbi:MAG: hypothetical protein Q4B29_02055 [Candidatus Saccharibacteria bacterium]|nr:hypothetical protein [Candidatus Saccharibacteria bacterium]